MLVWLDIALLPIHHLIALLVDIAPATIGIVLVTVAVRLALHPLNRATFRAGLHRRRLAPRIRQLQQRHRNNPERLQREIRELYAGAGLSPAAGCLPALAQMPVFAAMYRLCSAPEIAGQANVLLHHSLAGVPLTAQLFAVGGPQLWVFGGLLVLALGAAALTYRQALAALELEATGATRALPLLSFGTVTAVLVLPLGTGIYLVASAWWAWAERAIMRHTVVA